MKEYRNFIKKERLCKEFAELAGIDSVSLKEREMADCLIKKLEDLGFSVQEDDAGSICLDFSKVCSRKAFVFDLDGTVGIAIRKAASLISFEIEVHGHATHAASEPETAEIVKDYKKACDVFGLPGQLIRAFGGSDNNTFVQHGGRSDKRSESGGRTAHTWIKANYNSVYFFPLFYIVFVEKAKWLWYYDTIYPCVRRCYSGD